MDKNLVNARKIRFFKRNKQIFYCLFAVNVGIIMQNELLVNLLHSILKAFI